jgi:16S rRNA (cytosine967-C5)-methyltransferase
MRRSAPARQPAADAAVGTAKTTRQTRTTRKTRTTRTTAPGGPSARRVALDALVAVDRGGRANVAVPEMLARTRLETRDRALVTELVYGACRMRRACDWLVERHTRGRLDPEVRAALRLGAYQLGWMRVPAHAAVSATVEEVRGPGRSVVNAVLRRVAKQLSAGPVSWPDPATELSYPDWIVEQLARDLGPEPARLALETMNEPAAMTVRHDGYVQDQASQLVAAAVRAQPGERILDLCAAPGGKATALARQDPAIVVAADRSPERAAILAANATRLGAGRVATIVADGVRPPWPPASFHRVLVDAPCSGLGVLRRRPDARWRVQPDDVPRLAALQRRLLAAARPLLRPGGILVYSVCTLTAQETRSIDGWLARTAPDLVPLAPPGGPWQPWGRGALLLPQAAGTDGMFILSLRAP